MSTLTTAEKEALAAFYEDASKNDLRTRRWIWIRFSNDLNGGPADGSGFAFLRGDRIFYCSVRSLMAIFFQHATLTEFWSRTIRLFVREFSDEAHCRL